MEKLLTPEELADILGLSVQTIYNRRALQGPLPPSVNLGRRVRFRPEDVRAWLNDRANLSAVFGVVSAKAATEAALTPKRRGRPTKAEEIARRGIGVA